MKRKRGGFISKTDVVKGVLKKILPMDTIKKILPSAVSVLKVADVANDFAKKHKIPSRALSYLGYKDLASKAAKAGYGKKRRKRRVGGSSSVAVNF